MVHPGPEAGGLLSLQNCPWRLIGCRGVLGTKNMRVLTNISSMVGIRSLMWLRVNLGRIALLGSYKIWAGEARTGRQGNSIVRTATMYTCKLSHRSRIRNFFKISQSGIFMEQNFLKKLHELNLQRAITSLTISIYKRHN